MNLGGRKLAAAVALLSAFSLEACQSDETSVGHIKENAPNAASFDCTSAKYIPISNHPDYFMLSAVKRGTNQEVELDRITVHTLDDGGGTRTVDVVDNKAVFQLPKSAVQVSIMGHVGDQSDPCPMPPYPNRKLPKIKITNPTPTQSSN